MATNPTGVGNYASRGAIRRHRWHAKGRLLLAHHVNRGTDRHGRYRRI